MTFVGTLKLLLIISLLNQGKPLLSKRRGSFKCTKRPEEERDELRTTVAAHHSKHRDHFKCTSKARERGPDLITDAGTTMNLGSTISNRIATTDLNRYHTDSRGEESFSTFTNLNCTKMYICNNGTLHTNTNYSYSSEGVCEERNNVHMCNCSNDHNGDRENCSQMKDCSDWSNAGLTKDGIYVIKPTGWKASAFKVYCNMSNGDGWTVFQRRVNGSVDFYRNWTSYKEGFGELDHEFWLGNDKLYYLTNQGNYTLRIDLIDKHGNASYAEYDMFRINDENDNYRLSSVGNYNGTADNGREKPRGVALSFHLKKTFKTFDRDNAPNCAKTFHGAWWYRKGDRKCFHRSNLNGLYNDVNEAKREEGKKGVSITWTNLPGHKFNIKYSQMKIRRGCD